MYYLNHLVKKAKNKQELDKDLTEIMNTQEPILQNEGWNIRQMTQKLHHAQHDPRPMFDFQVQSTKEESITQTLEQPSPQIQPEQAKPKSDDYNFGGPHF